jgi:ABC-2 type transport system ATP-binding protein
MTSERPLSVEGLYKTFYLGLFAPVPRLRERDLPPLHRVIEAVRGVNLHVGRGEIVGLLGANGAGKSTTMKCLMGLIQPSRGRALLNGKPAHEPNARVGVGYLPENPVFYDELTPLETLELLGALSGVRAKERRREAERQLARVGMSHAQDRPLRRLSKGMHQRVGVAQALLGQPQLIILDEPLSGLDPIGRREVREVLLEERERGASIMLSSHILPDVEALCERVVMMSQGRVVREASMSALWGGDALSEVELTFSVLSDEERALLRELNPHRGELSQLPQGRGWRLTLPKRAQQEALKLCSDHGLALSQLQPVKLSLDAIFERLSTKNTHQVSETGEDDE